LAGLIAGESVSKYTEDELIFGKAAQSYSDKFGGSPVSLYIYPTGQMLQTNKH
jgi:hypothetical protein